MKLKHFYLVFPLILSCSHQAKTCLTETEIETVIGKLKPAYENMIAKDAAPMNMERTCHKAKFSIDKYIIMVYSDAKNGGAHGRLVKDNGLRTEAEAKECLDTAITSLSRTNIPGFTELLRLHKNQNPEQWADPDIGPMNWVHCRAIGDEYWESIRTLAHELNHESVGPSCVYVMETQKTLCLKIPEDLPTISIGKVDLSFITHPAAKDFFQKLQTTYFEALNQPFNTLLDELNAYTVTNMTWRGELEFIGKDIVIDKEGHRAGFPLPYFLLTSANYLVQLKDQNPRLYRLTFRQTENGKITSMLLKRAEAEWLKTIEALKKNGSEVKDFEKALFEKYKALRREIKF